MNTGEWIGVLLFGAGLLLYLFDRFPVGGWLAAAGQRVGVMAHPPVADALQRPSGPLARLTIEARLAAIEPGQFVQLLDGGRTWCTGNVLLRQLLSADNGNTWEATGNEFRIVQCGKRALVNIPTSDDGHPVWFDMKIAELQNLVQFIAGTPEDPGPAMRFADSNMQADVTFDWQNRQWQVVTLGECEFEAAAGANSFVTGRGQLRYMLARDADPANADYWLAIDKEDGRGEDVLLVGPEVDVEVAVEDII